MFVLFPDSKAFALENLPDFLKPEQEYYSNSMSDLNIHFKMNIHEKKMVIGIYFIRFCSLIRYPRFAKAAGTNSHKAFAVPDSCTFQQ